MEIRFTGRLSWNFNSQHIHFMIVCECAFRVIVSAFNSIFIFSRRQSFIPIFDTIWYWHHHAMKICVDNVDKIDRTHIEREDVDKDYAQQSQDKNKTTTNAHFYGRANICLC